MDKNKVQSLKEINGTYQWVEVECCPICGMTDHTFHCGRCGKPMVKHIDGKTQSCPSCTTRIGRF